LFRDANPAFYAFRSRRGQVRLGSRCDQRNDSRYTQLGTFFYRPFEAIKFENRDCDGDGENIGSGDAFAKLEIDTIRFNAENSSDPDVGSGRNLELLAELRAEDLGEVAGVIAYQGGTISGDFISDPATAGHARLV
jgi:hypothetical protein